MLVNGTSQQYLSLNNRALAYGDGVFETIYLNEGKPVFLKEHLLRLQKTCTALEINCDFIKLNSEIQSLAIEFEKFGILKIVISRGEGGRGYRPDKNLEATRILTLHSLPDFSGFDSNEGVAVFICQQRLSRQKSLAGIKHLNRLEQVMAAKEWPNDSFFEGLMLDVNDKVIEGTRTNLFFSTDGILQTPALTYAGINGVLRQYLLEKSEAKICMEENITLDRLLLADELFLCNSVIGVWPIKEIVYLDKSYYFAPGKFSEIAKEQFREAIGSFKTN
jgi:4-amino-4-deoxychorismate lyase